MPHRATSHPVQVSIDARNALGARPPDALFNLVEAALWTGISTKALRNLASGRTRTLRVDGRGAKRTPLFRRSTLDAFLAGRS